MEKCESHKSTEGENGAGISETCPVCCGPLGDNCWPHVRVPSHEGSLQLWHLACALGEEPWEKSADIIDERPAKRRALEGVENRHLKDFQIALRKLLEMCPDMR